MTTVEILRNVRVLLARPEAWTKGASARAIALAEATP